jgi:4-amino-4-deoxy-L-arabinose transferase-like glycosyltransferase
MTPIRSSAAFAEATTQVIPTLEQEEAAANAATIPARKLRKQERQGRRSFRPPERYTPNRRTTKISRLVLLAILCLQAIMSLRLHNTAFEDESLYLYSGHMELEHLLHGSALQGSYASYFSGSPVLYPLLAGALDQVGGLALTRALSLVEMLATTTLLYSLTRRLFNERIGLCAAGLFAVSESAIFLGNFATYDATCLSLLACAAWIMVRTAASRRPLFLLAAPLAALAVAVKYAGLLFVPTIAILPALAGWPERGRRVLWYPVAFGAAVAGLLLAALRLGGQAYMTAIQSTTTNRAQGATPDATILREAAEWGGVLFALAVIGTIAYIWRVRTEPGEKIAPGGERRRRAALGVVLTGTALLAPAYQAHLHTDISFLKHIGFGLFFAAPMAGFGLARIMGDYFRRPQFGIAAWSLALVLGMVQSSYLYHSWPSSGPFVSTFSRYLKPNAKYLVEVPEVPIYYLMGQPDAQPKQFVSTFFIVYKDKKGQTLTGPAGFTAAVQDGYFQVIAYNDTVTLAADGALAKALKASRSYYLAATVNLSDSFGPVRYYIWVKGHKPASIAPKATQKKS